MITDKFKEWACSLSGCDGGDIDAAEIWICGIEWGGGSYDNGNYYKNDLPEEIAKGKYDHNGKLYDWDEHTKYRFGISLAKLYTAIRGKEVSNYQEFIKTCNGSELFKLNLYPIAFDTTESTLWEKYELEKITGFSEKILFQTWCFLNRFPAISKLAIDKKPKLIIGTGVSYLRDFFMCFGGSSESSGEIKFKEIEAASESNKHHKRRYYWVKLNEDTTLVVIPFFSGSNGLNSDYLLQEMGNRIRALQI